MSWTRFWSATRHALAKFIAFWVLIFAAYLAIGRQFFPYVENLKPDVELWLSTQLGAPVTIGELQGSWVRFNPVVSISNLTVGEDLSISKMTLAPGIYESISRGGLSFIRFEIENFNADLRQTESGWQLGGYTHQSNSQNPLNLEKMLTLVRRQQEVKFTDVHLNIRPENTQAFELTLNQGRMVGMANDNELVANAVAQIDEFQIPVELQLETSLNPGVADRLYVRHGAIDLAPWLSLWDSQLSAAIVDGEYWIDIENANWQRITSRFNIKELSYEGAQDRIDLVNLKSEGYFTQDNGGIAGAINVLEYNMNSQQYNSSQARVNYNNNQLDLNWDSLPADLVGYWFSLNDKSGFWTRISPKGYVEQGQLSVNFNSLESVNLKAKIEDFSMSPSKSVPGLNNINGTLSIKGNGGEIIFESPQADINLQQLYTTPVQAKVNSGSLRWLTDPNYGLFSEGEAVVDLFPASDVLTTQVPMIVSWQSASPKTEGLSSIERTTSLSLSAKAIDSQWVKFLSNNLLVKPEHIEQLSTSLVEGAFNDVALDFLYTKDTNQKNYRQFFLNADFSDAQVKFLSNWQLLTGLSGQVSLTNQGLNIVSNSPSQYENITIPNTVLNIDFKQSILTSQVQAELNGSEMLTFLTSGPLSSMVDDRLASWEASGALSVYVDLILPLAEQDKLRVKTTTYLKNNTLEIKDIDQVYTEITGELLYDSDLGFNAKELNFSHAGEQQKASVSTDVSDYGSAFKIDVTGKTPIRYWGERYNLYFLADQNSVINHQTEIVIDANKTRILTQSNLVGVELPFPAPLNKLKDQSWPLQLDVTLDGRGWITSRSSLNKQFLGYVEIDSSRQMRRSSVAYNQPLKVRQEDGVFMDFTLVDIDADEWWKVLRSDQVQNLLASPEQDANSGVSLDYEININAGQLTWLLQPWHNLDTTLYRNSDGWLVSFTAEEGQGQVLVPHAEEAIFADLQWLSLTTGEDDIPFESQVDPLLDYLPSAIPPMSIQINKLIWNQQDMGSWRTEIISDTNQLQAKNILGEMDGATLQGQLTWKVAENDPQTSFIGEINVGNVQNVLNTWGHPPVLVTQRGKISVDVSWQGSPAFFDFKRLKGDVGINIGRGSILNVEDYEGIKLIGLLNFTRVLQRVALDFSDLLQSGITFDSIEGDLIFDRGFVRVGRKLEINGSATKFRFNGDADLLKDQLDVDMVLVVPLSSTFPLVALLAGVSPQAAAAIYVTELALNEELEQISSAKMHILGSFQSPEIFFYRVAETKSNTN